MFRRHYSLVLAAIWLLLGILLVAPETFLPPNLALQFLRFGMSGIVIAFTLSLCNLGRWMLHNLRPKTSELRRRPRGEQNTVIESEPNPDFDFFKSGQVQEQKNVNHHQTES